jgi:salicylate hydroxylase
VVLDRLVCVLEERHCLTKEETVWLHIAPHRRVNLGAKIYIFKALAESTNRGIIKEPFHSRQPLVPSILNKMSTPKITIAIAGGGIAGLSLAAGLIQHPQITVHVYESQCTYPRTGAGLALHKNAIAAMDLIHPGLKKTYLSRANLMSRDEEVELATQVLLAEGVHSGRVIGQLGKARGRKTIAREDLVMGWIGLLPAGTISFGKKLHNVVLDDGRVKLEFVDGTAAEADCLIGADGVRSATRRYLLGENHPATAPKNHDQWYLYSRAVPMDEARQVVKEEWTRNVAILCGSKGYMCSLPIDKGRILSCTFQAPGAFCGEPESFTTGLFHGYSEDARAIAEVFTFPSEYLSCQDTDQTSLSAETHSKAGRYTTTIQHQSTTTVESR